LVETAIFPHVSEALPYVAVVDDEPSVCRAFARLLRSARFDVATFASGAEFLSSLGTRRPGCVVLDLHMPEMNGFEVQANLAAHPEGKVPVVIITAHDSPEAQQRALAAGASAYLRKPIDAQPLLEAIRAAMTAAGE
jgi:FixJ family two-component response regulator